VATVLGTAGALVLQLYHSWGVRYGGRPRAWPLTLALQTALVFLPFMLLPVRYTGGLVPFVAGSFLLLVPGWRRWAGYAGVVTSWTVLFAVVPQSGQLTKPGYADVLYVLAANAGVGLLVYALTWMAAAARQLAGLRAELARMAAATERLRVARDVHDLLGLGLSAIALKTDLIGRLIGRDDGRAAAEITETSRLCAAARADIRLVTDTGHAQSLTAECAAARDILSSAGVTVELDVLAAVPAGADSVLAPVLREAVTNILRHSAATSCTIRAAASGGGLRLDISNDGAPADPASPIAVASPATAASPVAGTAAGRGLANLAARVHAAGGWLTAGQHGARFELSAEIPLPGQALPGQAAPGQARPDQAGRPAGSR
jgi:two-component system sensor histidine kinase DesK